MILINYRMEVISALHIYHVNTCSLILFQLRQVMVVGIDCYHDTLAGKQSIAGFVASLNQTMTR